MPQNPIIYQINKLPLFFILGRPRSGTTLLRTLLDAHPNVNIPLENSGLIHLYFKYRNVKQWDPTNIEQLFSDFQNLKFIESWNIDWEGLKEIFDNSSDGQLSFPEIIRVYYYHYQSEFIKKEIKCLGDKSPLNSLYSEEILSVFPKAKFIHLVRDYRANFASMRKHLVFSPSSTVKLMQWKKSVIQISRLAALNPKQFLIVRYEDFVSDPESTYKVICNFLKIKFIPELLDPEYRKNTINAIYASEFINDWQPDLSGKISTSNIDKWKNDLSNDAIKKADYIAGEIGERLQYNRIYKEFSLLYTLKMEFKKLLFQLNEMNRYLYDRLPYTMKGRIKNRRFSISNSLIQFYHNRLGNQ